MCKTILTLLLFSNLALAGSTQNPFSGLPPDPASNPRWSTFWWADFDDDGILDALVLHPSAPVRLFRHTGQGRFDDVTQQAGLAGILGASQALWADFTGDGRPDLFLTVPGGRSRLLGNSPGGLFTDLTQSSGLALEEGVLHAETLDYDQDGVADLLLVAPLRERFYRNLGGGIFEELALDLPPREHAAPARPVIAGESSADEAGEAVKKDEAAKAGGAVRRAAPGASGRVRDTGAGAAVDVLGTGAPSIATTPIGNNAMGPFSVPCARSVDDFSNPGNCIQASRDPLLGMLYPLSENLFVSSLGYVGIGTTNPISPLQVQGTVRIHGQIIASVDSGPPLQVNSTDMVQNLNAGLLGGLERGEYRQVSVKITGGDLQNNTISEAKLADGSVSSQKLANGAVGATKLADEAVTTVKLADGAVTAAKLAPGALDGAVLGPDSVDTTHIVDGTILDADISAQAAIAGTKISPDFGAQVVVTTGRMGVGTAAPQTSGMLDVLAQGSTPTGLRVRNTASAQSPVAARFESVGHNTSLGISAEGRSTGVFARATNTGLSIGGDFENAAGSIAVRGRNLTSGGQTFGGHFSAASNTGTGGAGVLGHATATSGTNYGVFGQTDSPTGYAGYFFGGRNYFQGNVGIGTTNPQAKLHLQDGGTEVGVKLRANLSWTAEIVQDQDSLFKFVNGGATRMTIRPGGQVGIGTEEPGTFTLAVNGSAAKPGGGSWSVFSDRRLKHGIEPLEPGTLERLLALRGYTFEYSDEAVAEHLALPGIQTGLIAQEVAAVFPDWVETDEKGYLFISERGTTALMVEALRELRAEKDGQIEALEEELASASQRIAELEARALAQEARLTQLAGGLAALLEGSGR